MRRFVTFLKIAALAIFILFCIFLAAVFLGEPLHQGITLRRTILNAISTANSIRITEHSSPYDDRAIPEDQYKERIFKQFDFPTKDTGLLIQALPVSLDYSGTTGVACFFQDHHRIELIQSDGSIFKIDICFLCGELSINDGSKRLMPVSWKKSLRTFFKSLDMQPDGKFQKNG